MTCNIGNIERVLRAIVGLALISLVFVGPQTPWGWLGLVPLATAVSRLVPAIRPVRHQHLRREETARPEDRHDPVFLLPGDLICNAFGLEGESEHRQVLRSFFNMMIWGAISIGVALKVML